MCDKNGNGKIELDEVPTQEELMKLFEDKPSFRPKKVCFFRVEDFKIVDSNEDNVTTKEELMAFSDEKRMMHRSKISVPTKEEREKRALQGFKMQLKRCDKNSDGNITLKEITSVQCFMTSDIFLQYTTDAKGSFEISKVTKAPKEERVTGYEDLIDRCDKDRDKKLDLVEATSFKCHLSSDEFSRIDKNGDGFLVQEELNREAKELNEPSSLSVLNESRIKNMPPQILVHMSFSICNKDGDEKLTQKEAEDCNLSMEKFKSFDYDNSNTIEANDIERVELIESFKMVDMNSDNSVDAQEFSERMGRRCHVF